MVFCTAARTAWSPTSSLVEASVAIGDVREIEIASQEPCSMSLKTKSPMLQSFSNSALRTDFKWCLSAGTSTTIETLPIGVSLYAKNGNTSEPRYPRAPEEIADLK